METKITITQLFREMKKEFTGVHERLDGQHKHNNRRFNEMEENFKDVMEILQLIMQRAVHKEELFSK